MSPRKRIFTVAAISLFTFLLAISFWPTAGGRAASGSDTDAADYISTPEKDLIREINLVRADPLKYAANLEQMKKYYKGKDYKAPGQTVWLTTNEGTSAVDEAIIFLRAAKPLPPYTLSKGMTLAAKDHVKDLGKTGNTGHRGTDGSTTESRVNRYGNFSNGIGENIVYQSDTAREIVLGWLVDDGVSTRGHRRNLLSTNYRHIGVAIGERTGYGSMCVLTFAGAYAESNGAPVSNPNTAVQPKGTAQPKSGARKM